MKIPEKWRRLTSRKIDPSQKKNPRGTTYSLFVPSVILVIEFRAGFYYDKIQNKKTMKNHYFASNTS